MMQMTSAVADEAFGPATQKASFAGRAVMRSPENLTLHQVLAELGRSGAKEEMDDLATRGGEIAPEPILITSQNTILAGVAGWRWALLQRTAEVHCIEYSISEEEQLQSILAYHKPRGAGTLLFGFVWRSLWKQLSRNEHSTTCGRVAETRV